MAGGAARVRVAGCGEPTGPLAASAPRFMAEV